MNSSSYSPRFAAPLQEKYDVFLSFRGLDTRDTFTSHLHKALLGKKIETYMDNRLEKGDDIGPALVEAIEKSKIALVIFSKDYASSTWCLKELVHILGCKKRNKQIVIPIFYGIDPSHVRKQQGTFALEHRPLKRSRDEVANWRAALEEAANMSGFHDSSKTGTEADFIEKIVKDILKKLNHESSSDLKGLIGIEGKIKQIESLLCLDSPGVCCVGIWGMGGIGKTTLADAVFHRLACKFEASCFLKNVRENSEERDGIYRLRDKLVRDILKDNDVIIDTLSIGSTCTRKRLSRTRALFVIDDVNAPSQLEVLIGDHDQFCNGSRIIITARDKGVLEQNVNHDKIYKVEGLSYEEALQLFHSHAFKNKSPTTDYTDFSRQVVHYIKGIPLALKIMGSLFLRCKSKQEWKDEMNKLKRFPSQKIHKVLRVSYDGLEENEKEIFLDIACFHKHKNMKYVKRMLDSRGFFGAAGIRVLIDMSLISISWNCIEMHDLVQEMGRAIVHEQCIEEPGKRSRLFSAADVYHVLTNNEGAATVEAVIFNWFRMQALNPTNHADFKKMYKLRFLHLENFYVLAHENVSLDLPNSLSYFHRTKFPSKSLPSKFSPHNLVELHLPCSQVRAQLWNEGQSPVNLKVINLRCCQHLTQVPNLSRSLKIEHIDLSGCMSLVEIPSYFQYLDKLTYLGLGCCIKLKKLRKMPCNVEFLDLSTTGIKELPPKVWSHQKISDVDTGYCGDLNNLPRLLDLSQTAIKELSSSIECLSGLTKVKLVDCKRLVSLPANIWKLKYLESLDLRECSTFQYFPEILEPMEHLEFLSLSGTAVKELPSSIGNLVALKKLDLHNCRHLEVVPDELVCLPSLQELNMKDTKINSIPASIKQAAQLYHLCLIRCKSLKSLPELPPSLQCLEADGCTSLKTVSSSSTVLTQCWDEYIFSPGLHEKHIFSRCPMLDQNARSNLMDDAQLRIMRMATASSKFKEIKDDSHELDDSDDSDVSHISSDEYDSLNINDEIKKQYGRRSLVAIKCPGYEIPKWFSHQSEGSSIKIQLPPDWFSTDFLGFALSLVIALKNHDAECRMYIRCKYNFKTSNGESHEINDPLYTPYPYGSCFQVSHEVFVWWYNVFEEVVEGARSPTAFYKLFTEVHVDFNVLDFGEKPFSEEDLVVEKCGICLLYGEDAEIIKHRTL